MLSIIIPVFNEQDSLEQLHREISDVASAESLEIEVILVDDGSNDASWTVIEKLSAGDDRVRGVRFRGNFGKAAALTAAMREANGELLLMMDADLQDDPTEIPSFLEALDDGYDLVNGWKKTRHDPWHKVFPSRVFNWLVSRTTGLKLHDHNCGIKLFRRAVAEEIRIYGEQHRFIAVLAHSRGFRVTERAVNHRKRQFGKSKYGIRRFTRGLLDLFTVRFLTGYGQRPQHLLGFWGLIFFSLGMLGLFYLGVLWLLMNPFGVLEAEPIGPRPLLAYSIAATILGAQALSLGLMAELVVANSANNDNYYSIRERTGDASSSAVAAGGPLQEEPPEDENDVHDHD